MSGYSQLWQNATGLAELPTPEPPLLRHVHDEAERLRRANGGDRPDEEDERRVVADLKATYPHLWKP